MKVSIRCLLLLVAVPIVAIPSRAQHRDPLNNAEIDQLRETNQEPDQRLKLIVKFARARLDSVDQIRSDPKTAAADRPSKIHDALEDFLSIYDELGDNLDMYREQRADLRKPLKEIVEADSEFRSKLDKVREATTPDQLKEYGFVLTNITEALRDGTEEHRRMLREANAQPRKKK